MKLWNRRDKADRKAQPLAGDPRLSDEAIYLATPDPTARKSEAASTGPRIRERHFGLGVRPKAGSEPVVKKARGTLLGRLGFGRSAPDEEPAYSGTLIRKAGSTAEDQPPFDPATADDDKVLERIFGVKDTVETGKPVEKPLKPAVRKPKTRKKLDRSDITLGALGITLGLTCALFPWYIFFNQEQFGVREFVFEGRNSATPSGPVAYQPKLVGKPFSTGEVPRLDLDFFPTATLPEENETVRAVPASEQPFPLDLVNFKLVHVANGRAMIEDADGLWVVQPGSRLPDASRVASIEQRNGSWVLVTSLDKVIELTN